MITILDKFYVGDVCSIMVIIVGNEYSNLPS